MNWGWNIVFAFTGFVAFIVYLAIRSFQTNIDLVTEDYYQQELQYQQQIEKMANTKHLAVNLTIAQKDQQLIIQFPEAMTEEISGTISLFRPSDARFDLTEAIAINTGQQHRLNVDQLPKGHYKVKVDWKTGAEAYYSEKPIYLH